MILWSFILMQLLDLLTFSLLPNGAEVHPVAILLGPGIAVWAKAYLVASGATMWYYHQRYVVPVLQFGALVGAIGFGSNLSTLLAR